MKQQNSPAPQSPKLLDQVRELLITRRYARSTERAYLTWIERYLRYFRRKTGRWIHPTQLGVREIEEFLTHLAVEQNVSASTQNQALAGLLFLYQQVLQINLPPVDALRARCSNHLPLVLSQEQVAQLLQNITGAKGQYRLMAKLMYGAGMRLMEVCRLRVQDVNCERLQIVVRRGKGNKDRFVPIPPAQ